MADMQAIELQAAAVAEARGILEERVADLQAELDAVRRKHLPKLRQAANAATGDVDRLRALIDDSRELFDKPRTRVLHGIRCGVTKQRGSVVIIDEERTIKRIRDQLPTEQAELLIRVRESVHKPAVYDLTAADLKRLGITIEADNDAVVVKPTDGAIDKLVDALLAEAELVEGAA